MDDLAENEVDAERPAAGVVYVVDDDPSLRRALVRRLVLEGYTVQSYDSAEAFLAANISDSIGPACILLDVKMVGMSGLAMQRELIKRRMQLPIVFLTAHGDVPMSVDAMRSGASHFLLKPVQDRLLLQAIQEALASWTGAAYLHPKEVEERLATLSAREKEVFALVVSGLPNKAIAAELGIAEITVKVHRGAVMRKMKAGSLPELVRMHAALSV